MSRLRLFVARDAGAIAVGALAALWAGIVSTIAKGH